MLVFICRNSVPIDQKNYFLKICYRLANLDSCRWFNFCLQSSEIQRSVSQVAGGRSKALGRSNERCLGESINLFKKSLFRTFFALISAHKSVRVKIPMIYIRPNFCCHECLKRNNFLWINLKAMQRFSKKCI